MTVHWGRRDTWTIIAGVRDRHRRDEEGHCSACRSDDCGYQDRTASYLDFVNPALLRHQTLREPPAGHAERHST
ncbi:MAG: hypothetical protein JXA67_09030 [Micromonosporaceae bacterium]|nr:hypothetical protein [Micromonosporaceae bacterium]